LQGRSWVNERTVLEDAIRRAADPGVVMRRVAEEALALVAGAEGALVGLVHDESCVTIECAAGHVGEHVGDTVPLEGSLTGLAFRTGETLRCDDAASDPRVDLELCRAFRVLSVVAVPLWRGGRTVGVFHVNSSRPNAFDDHDVATLKSLAEFISVAVAAAIDLAGITDALLSPAYHDAPGAATVGSDDWEAKERFMANVLNPGAMGRLEARRRVDRFLDGRGLSHVFQPVFDMKTGDCFAVEALARFSGQPKRPPDAWFSEAHAMGVGVELEVASVKGALSRLAHLPEHVALCVNAGPLTIISDELLDLLALSEPKRIVVELTEQTKVDDYPRLSSALAQLCSLGARLAIDDTGAGFASLAHILKLAPNLIKLDRELTSGIDHDPVRRALGTALVSFAAGLGAEIIAEGIETAAELEMLRRLGIRYGQGYYLCRPTSLHEIPGRLAARRLSRRESRAS